MNDNALVHLGERIFDYNENLEQLWLMNNDLHHAFLGWFSNKPKMQQAVEKGKADVLYLDGNSWECDCMMRELGKYCHTKSVDETWFCQDEDRSMSSVKCMQQSGKHDEFSGKDLKHVDLSSEKCTQPRIGKPKQYSFKIG